MTWYDQCTDDYNNYQNAEPHEASLSHELLAGAASFEAAKSYEDHKARNGQPTSHAEAKRIVAGFAGAFVDREIETRGLDWIDREEAKRQAIQNAHDGLGGCGDW